MIISTSQADFSEFTQRRDADNDNAIEGTGFTGADLVQQQIYDAGRDQNIETDVLQAGAWRRVVWAL